MFSAALEKRQKLNTEFFQQTFKKGKLANAYLFTGDAPKDKIKLALEICQALNCEQLTESGPCGTCSNCKWILDGKHPMTPLYLEPSEESKKGIVTVEQVSELQKELAKSSSYYRVVIISDASYKTLNKHSANALLKILEEPNPNTLFILFAEAPETVLATIKSRSLELKFNYSPVNEYSEEAQDLFQEYLGKLENNNRLDIITLAEDLSQNDNKLLVEFLEVLQNSMNSKLNNSPDLATANKILAIEKAKSDIQSFVRPKNAMEELLISLN